jgi:DNA-binding NarL/FixJ family response regulator
MAARARILIADDHRIMLDGLRRLLQEHFHVVGTVTDGRALVRKARALAPDVLVVDIAMPLLNGIAAIRELKQLGTGVKIVVLTMHADRAYVKAALGAGAIGFVAKVGAADELVAAIHAALRGEAYVTPALIEGSVARLPPRETAPDPTAAAIKPRQREILKLVAEGRTIREIADILKVSTKTVEYHKYQLMERLDLHTTADLTKFAYRYGIVD